VKFNRIDAKLAARASMRNAVPNCILVTLVFVLLSSGVAALVSQVIPDPFQDAFEDLYYWGYDVEKVIEADILRRPEAVSRHAVAQCLLSFYGTVVGFGYVSYALRLSRNEFPGYANLFDGFYKAGRIIWMSMLTGAFIWLWTMLGMLPGCALLVTGIVLRSELMAGLGAVAGSAGGMAAGLLAGLGYALSSFFLLDDPECTALQGITRSKNAMRGWRMELLMLHLSFFGWLLLTALAGGAVSGLLDLAGAPLWLQNLGGALPMVWLTPYMKCSQANFYNAVTGGLASGGPGRWTGPEPF